MKLAVAAYAALLCAAPAALAQDAAPPVTDWAMEVVVVHANQQAPAMWHLKKGDAEIWILGTVGPLPKNLAWNKAPLTDAIDGAKVVLLPPVASTGVLDMFDMGWFMLTHWGSLSMPDGQKLEASLQPDLRARFVKAREAVGQNADRYENRKPLVAGFVLLSDFNKHAGLEIQLPEAAAEKIADAKHVKVRRIADYDAMPLVKEMLKMPPEQGRVCFETALGDYETRSVHALPAAEAWAVGNVAGIKAHYSTSHLESCVKQAHKYDELNRRAVADMSKAIHDALATPGKTVMVMDVGDLFRSTGVAEQLKKEGVTIEGPAE